MPPLTPPPHPCVVTILQPLAVPRRRHRYAARCRAVRERACALVAFATLATSRCHRRLCHPCHCISPGTARAICTVVTEPRRHSPSALFRVVSHGVLSAAVLSRERQGKGRRAVGRLQRGAEDLRSRAHPPGTETRKSMPRAGREACTPGRKTRGLVRKDRRCFFLWRIWVSIPVPPAYTDQRRNTEKYSQGQVKRLSLSLSLSLSLRR